MNIVEIANNYRLAFPSLSDAEIISHATALAISYVENAPKNVVQNSVNTIENESKYSQLPAFLFNLGICERGNNLADCRFSVTVKHYLNTLLSTGVLTNTHALDLLGYSFASSLTPHSSVFKTNTVGRALEVHEKVFTKCKATELAKAYQQVKEFIEKQLPDESELLLQAINVRIKPIIEKLPGQSSLSQWLISEKQVPQKIMESKTIRNNELTRAVDNRANEAAAFINATTKIDEKRAFKSFLHKKWKAEAEAQGFNGRALAWDYSIPYNCADEQTKMHALWLINCLQKAGYENTWKELADLKNFVVSHI